MYFGSGTASTPDVMVLLTRPRDPHESRIESSAVEEPVTEHTAYTPSTRSRPVSALYSYSAENWSSPFTTSSSTVGLLQDLLNAFLFQVATGTMLIYLGGEFFQPVPYYSLHAESPA